MTIYAVYEARRGSGASVPLRVEPWPDGTVHIVLGSARGRLKLSPSAAEALCQAIAAALKEARQ